MAAPEDLMLSKTIATRLGIGLLAVAVSVSLSAQQQMQPTPNRKAGEGEGPFDRMVIRGITVIDGTGAPPRGPMDVVVEQGVIREVQSVGFPMVPVGDRRPAKGTKEFDGTGMYLMPGFVDAHVHCGGGQAANP
jgi:imidazolonepropionase-like amidohydrolase